MTFDEWITQQISEEQAKLKRVKADIAAINKQIKKSKSDAKYELERDKKDLQIQKEILEDLVAGLKEYKKRKPVKTEKGIVIYSAIFKEFIKKLQQQRIPFEIKQTDDEVIIEYNTRYGNGFLKLNHIDIPDDVMVPTMEVESYCLAL